MNFKEVTLIHVLLCISFIVSGLLVNLVQLILFLTLANINQSLYRRINYYLIYLIYCQLLALVDWWGPASLTMYCDPDSLQMFEEFRKEHAVVLMNHHYELDWLYGWMVGDRAGVLGNCRVYMKKILQYVPILGWAWKLSDVIFLERNWEKDKDHLATKLNQLLDYPSPMWILLFPEGTRFSKEKYAASLEFSTSRGLPPLKHHLVPRTKGFSFTVSRLDPSRISALYDVTLVAGMDDSAPPTLTSVLYGKVTKASMYIRKFPLKDIPKDEAGSAAWLMNLFQEKDQLKESFLQTGCFSELSGFPKYQPIVKKSRVYSLIITIIMNICVIGPLLYFIISGGLYTRLIVVVLLLLAWLAMHRLVNMTKISKSSEYGKSPRLEKKEQ